MPHRHRKFVDVFNEYVAAHTRDASSSESEVDEVSDVDDDDLDATYWQCQSECTLGCPRKNNFLKC